MIFSLRVAFPFNVGKNGARTGAKYFHDKHLTAHPEIHRMLVTFFCSGTLIFFFQYFKRLFDVSKAYPALIT